MLHSYVNDLCEQNEVLVQTVEELEKEANDRVVLLEGKLQKTSTSVKVRNSIVFILNICIIDQTALGWWF